VMPPRVSCFELLAIWPAALGSLRRAALGSEYSGVSTI
jgi:hypothetical protein